VVLSFGSDTRGDFVNIRSFFNAEVKNLVEQAMSRAVNEVDRYKGIYQIKPAPYKP
jgi:hypothetical protein